MILLLCIVSVLFLGNLSASAQPSGASESSAPEFTGKDGAPMVLVPAGEFSMGSPDGASDERPVHQVQLDAYYIDKFEVTTGRYAQFLKGVKRKPPDKWNEVNFTFDWARPVVGVDWSDAEAYCRWAGKRLPTEAEWEKAARGTDGRKYPWGMDEPSDDLANYDWDSRRTWRGYTTLTPVGSYDTGKSPYFMYDAGGNAWEWVADWYSPNTYQNRLDRNPKGPPTGGTRVTRGGSWADKAYSIRATNRRGVQPSERYRDLGFRCAQDAPTK